MIELTCRVRSLSSSAVTQTESMVSVTLRVNSRLRCTTSAICEVDLLVRAAR